MSGLCFADEERLLSCGVDRNIKLWDVRRNSEDDSGPLLELTEKVGYVLRYETVMLMSRRGNRFRYILGRMLSSE